MATRNPVNPGFTTVGIAERPSPYEASWRGVRAQTPSRPAQTLLGMIVATASTMGAPILGQECVHIAAIRL